VSIDLQSCQHGAESLIPLPPPFQPPSFLIVPWVLHKVQSQSK